VSAPDLALATAPDPLAVVERGLAVFALPPGGRRPTGPGWQARCSRDPDLVRRQWRPGDNIGVGCRSSNLVGLDLDRHGVEDLDAGDVVDGVATFAAVCAAHGQPWPATLTVRTPSGGLHLYFRAADWCTIASSSGGRAGLGAGVDVRGPGRRSGGYLIGPGSIVGGSRYVIVRDVAIAPLPAWLAALLQAPEERPA
jgi:hypothetical protein